MKLKMSSTNVLIGAIVGLAVLALAFWVLALSPKREEAAELATEVEEVEAALAVHRQEAATAEQARRDFPANYQEVVVLGKAVPGDSETASLLVQVQRISERTGMSFRTIQLSSEGGEGEGEAAPVPAASSATPAPPTEVAASLLPLGAAVGPAGLAVMPYTLALEGDFFSVADFIEEIDSMVETKDGEVVVDGRLLTVDGFTFAPAGEGFPALRVTFAMTSYVTPPGQDVTAEATPAGPGTVPVSSATGEAP
jgi:hypothetical protein